MNQVSRLMQQQMLPQKGHLQTRHVRSMSVGNGVIGGNILGSMIYSDHTDKQELAREMLYS